MARLPRRTGERPGAGFSRKLRKAPKKQTRFIPRGSLNQHLIQIEAPPSPLSSRPNPDFLPRGTKNGLVCGFHQGKPHELCGSHRAQREIRASGGICSSLNQPLIQIEAPPSPLSSRPKWRDLQLATPVNDFKESRMKVRCPQFCCTFRRAKRKPCSYCSESW